MQVLTGVQTQVGMFVSVPVLWPPSDSGTCRASNASSEFTWSSRTPRPPPCSSDFIPPSTLCHFFFRCFLFVSSSWPFSGRPRFVFCAPTVSLSNVFLPTWFLSESQVVVIYLFIFSTFVPSPTVKTIFWMRQSWVVLNEARVKVKVTNQRGNVRLNESGVSWGQRPRFPIKMMNH